MSALEQIYGLVTEGLRRALHPVHHVEGGRILRPEGYEVEPPPGLRRHEAERVVRAQVGTIDSLGELLGIWTRHRLLGVRVDTGAWSALATVIDAEEHEAGSLVLTLPLTLSARAALAHEDDEESDIVIAGRQVPFVQVGMIVHPDDCLNCERDGSPLWCSALVCDIHDDDETARFGMMATLLFRNGERREEPCDELRRRWRLARDFDQGRVYTGRWGAIPRGSVWPVAEVNEDA